MEKFYPNFTVEFVNEFLKEYINEKSLLKFTSQKEKNESKDEYRILILYISFLRVAHRLI